MRSFLGIERRAIDRWKAGADETIPTANGHRKTARVNCCTNTGRRSDDLSASWKRNRIQVIDEIRRQQQWTSVVYGAIYIYIRCSISLEGHFLYRPLYRNALPYAAIRCHTLPYAAIRWNVQCLSTVVYSVYNSAP